MPDYKKIIRKIEKQIGRRLERVEQLSWDLTGYILTDNTITGLFLSACGITDISFLKDLPHLTELELRGNPIADFSFLGRLQKLTRLDLMACDISDVYFLKDLPHLRELELSWNSIADFSFLQYLTNIHWVDVYRNQIKILPPEVAELPHEIKWSRAYLDDGEKRAGLYLERNPFETPPVDVVKQGNEAILNYYRELRAKEIDHLYEAKLIIVGENRAGKSSLMEALTDPKYKFEDQKSTEGINITPWTIPKAELGLPRDFRLNIWDFGGQEIYHSTHQFFLTKRSVYLLVTEARKEMRHDEFYYWLNIIELLSQKSPVVILLNKSDQPHTPLAVRDFEDKFINIFDSFEVSCTDDSRDTIKRLRAVICKIVTDKAQLPDIGAKLPKVWVDIRRRLEELREKGSDYISYDQYLEICGSFGMNEERALFLSDYFHDLGVFLHFRDDLQLTKTIFLNFEYVTKAVYNVLDNQKVINNGGSFDNDDLQHIWSEERFKDKQPELLALMKNEKFELCFDLKDGRYLSPRLLPEDTPQQLHGFERPQGLAEPLYYEYRYKFMPKGILTRLIVRLNKYVYNETYWRYGVLLEFDNTTAMVREFYYNKKISIVLTGENKKQLLGIIRKNIKDINDCFQNLHVQEMIPCNCPDCKASPDGPHYYEIEHIRNRLRKGKHTVGCKSGEDVNIHEIVGDVVFEKEKGIILGDLHVYGSASIADRVGQIVHERRRNR